jgi:hypothetical protein
MKKNTTQTPSYAAVLAILNALARRVAEMAANSRQKEEAAV